MTDGEHLFAFFGSRGLYCVDLDSELQREPLRRASRLPLEREGVNEVGQTPETRFTGVSNSLSE